MPSDGLHETAGLGGGANQARARAHNERLVMTLLHRNGSLSKAEIARRIGLTAQAVTVIMRALEADGLLLRGKPVRGKVGQPSIPMSLNPDGAMSLGLKIGRRSADLIAMDLVGGIRFRRRITYTVPDPAQLTAFLRDGQLAFEREFPAEARPPVAGVGVAMPFELWNWADQLGVPRDRMAAWRDFDVCDAFGKATGMPVMVQNDGTAACGAELLFGRGREVANYAYFFIGYFVGGGVVLDNTLQTGPTGNAGGFGTIRIQRPGGRAAPLLDCASLHLLESALADAGTNPSALWNSPGDWTVAGPVLDEWEETAAQCLVQAILSACSVMEFEAVILDGNLPPAVRARLVRRVSDHLEEADLQGIRPFELREGSLGYDAQVLGGASLPIMGRYLVDNSVLFGAPS